MFQTAVRAQDRGQSIVLDVRREPGKSSQVIAQPKRAIDVCEHPVTDLSALPAIAACASRSGYLKFGLQESPNTQVAGVVCGWPADVQAHLARALLP